MKLKRIILLSFFCVFTQIAIAQVSVIKVIPHRTDTAIHTFIDAGYEHYVYFDKSVPKRNQLLIFLSGTNGKGGGGRSFNMLAASLGYHVINLIYPNKFSLSRFQKSIDLENYAKGREEIITGKDLSSEIKVDRANSIENRLFKVLLRLNELYPNQNWGQYLDKSGEFAWNKIAIAGQSQGGGHAAFIAKKHELARVIMFASPKDYNVRLHQPPPWISGESKTPLNRQYSFVHQKDDHNACTYPEQQQIWKAYGLYEFGKEADVDKVKPPYNYVHLLTSSKPQKSPHGSVLQDISYKEAWIYMLTAEK